jgi:hypothetical protein
VPRIVIALVVVAVAGTIAWRSGRDGTPAAPAPRLTGLPACDGFDLPVAVDPSGYLAPAGFIARHRPAR